jgi:putative ABC transport system substrate-binding protein
MITALSATLLTSPFALHAQPATKVWRIGFHGTASAAGYVREVDAIREELRKPGYVEGRNVAIEFRRADNDPAHLKGMASELAGLKVDAAITKKRVDAKIISEDPMFNASTSVTAALAATHLLPAISITSFAEAGGLPGYSASRPLLYAKSPFTSLILKSTQEGAAAQNLSTQVYEVSSVAEFDKAFAAIAKARPDAMVVLGDTPFRYRIASASCSSPGNSACR